MENQIQCPKCNSKETTNTSIRVNAKMWEDFKIYCIKNKVSMTDKIDELIRKEIRK